MLYCRDCPHATEMFNPISGLSYYTCELSSYQISNNIMVNGGVQINCPLPENAYVKHII